MALRKNPTAKGQGRPADENAQPKVRRKTQSEGELSSVRSELAKKAGKGGKVELSDEARERAADKKRKAQLKPSEEAELVALWESGEFTLKELAERFNRTPENLSRYFSLNGIIKGSKAEEYARQVNERILNIILGDSSQTALKIKQIKNDHLAKMDMLQRLSMNEIAKAKENNLPYHTALPNLRALKELQSILITCRTEQYEVLGVIDFQKKVEQDDVPELLVSELTNDEVEEMRKTQRELLSLEDGIDVPEEIEVIDEQ